MERKKFQSDLMGYPQNLINDEVLSMVSNQTHPIAKLPSYSKDLFDGLIYEEKIIDDRIKDILNSLVNINPKYGNLNKMSMFFKLSDGMGNIINIENKDHKYLISLCEKIVRSEFNLDENEVKFDLEIVTPNSLRNCPIKEQMITDDVIDKNFEPSEDYDVIKKNIINCLGQGSAISSHYIFHMYSNEFNKLDQNLTKYYNETLKLNDLMYYTIGNDVTNSSSCCDNMCSYVNIRYENGIPVIEAKAICAPYLIHEMIKGIIMLLSLNGIQNMSQDTIEETDTVASEFWAIRFGVTFWSKFHSIIDPDDYDIKKLIIMDIFNMDSEYFVKTFMFNVFNYPDKAKNDVNRIVKDIRYRIMDYNMSE